MRGKVDAGVVSGSHFQRVQQNVRCKDTRKGRRMVVVRVPEGAIMNVGTEVGPVRLPSRVPDVCPIGRPNDTKPIPVV